MYSPCSSLFPSMELNYKELFIGWLKDEMAAAMKKGSKAAFQYSKAVESILSNSVGLVNDLKTLKSVKYIGDRTVTQLVTKLRRHCDSEGVDFPSSFTQKRTRPEDEGAATEGATKKRAKSKRVYIPSRRSGGFAILLALYTQDVDRNGLTQEEVVKFATPFCDKSFKSNPAANQFYSAWSSVKQLEKHDLVKCTGRPKRYYLTEEGFDLSTKLKSAEGLETPKKRLETNNNIEESVSGLSYDGVQFDRWGADEYDIVLVIDTREVRSQSERDFFQKTITSSSSFLVNCEVLPLSVGDGLWKAKHKVSGEEVVLNYIFERKRIDDLAFSIRDGRFLEQKSRLKMAAMKYNYYIVEEAGFDSLGVSVSGEALQTAISMTITQSNFYLRKFKAIEDTVSFLVSLTEVIIEEHQRKTLLVLKPKDMKNQFDYQCTIGKFRKHFENKQSRNECVYTFETFQIMMAKSMVTVKDTFIQMLLCVRGISFEKACTIQKHFKTPKHLLEFFKENSHLSDKEKRLLISDLFKHHIGNKKVGPSLSDKIYQIWGSG